jgi:hypothetical protein
MFMLFVISAVLFSAQGDNLTIKVAVMGPGDELYFWFGHIALVIEDSRADTSYFYDYGLFSFDDDHFFYNFAFGRLLYSCGASPTNRNYDIYMDTNRDITVYTLDLPPEKKIEIRNFADYNILPENRQYYYHVFDDNCCTRIRDIIDLATDGQFKERYGNEKGRFTLRQHVRRHTWFSFPVDWILNLWMGQNIDLPITVWDEMFLPSEVGKRIEDFWYTDNHGLERKLTTSVETVYKANNRPVVLDTPRRQWPRELFVSLILSAIVCGFYFLEYRKINMGTKLTGFSMAFAGFVFGIASILLYFLSLFTNHDYTYHNTNLIFATPLLIASVPFGFGYAFAKNDKKRAVYSVLSRLVWAVTVLGILISLFIKVFPPFWQQNLTDQMFMLPISLTFVFHPLGLGDLFKKVSKR